MTSAGLDLHSLIQKALRVTPPETWTVDECETVLGALTTIAERRVAALADAGDNVIPFKLVTQ